MTFVLLVVALAAGIAVGSLGPGGVLVTIALLLGTDLGPAEVAGTSLVTQIAVGLVGTAAFVGSGQLRDPDVRKMAGILIVASLLGTPLGVALNSAVSSSLFQVGLGLLAAMAGALVLLRELNGDSGEESTTTVLSTRATIAIGVVVAVSAGLFGVGGPLLAVPLLVLCRLRLLVALAAAQAQSVAIAVVGSVGYLAQDAIDARLALIVGVPQLLGVLLGWRLAHRVSSRTLTSALGVVLIAMLPLLLWTR